MPSTVANGKRQIKMQKKKYIEKCSRGKEIIAQPKADWDFEYLLMVMLSRKEDACRKKSVYL